MWQGEVAPGPHTLLALFVFRREGAADDDPDRAGPGRTPADLPGAPRPPAGAAVTLRDRTAVSSTVTVVSLRSTVIFFTAGAKPGLRNVSDWVEPTRAVRSTGVTPSGPRGPDTSAPAGRLSRVMVTSCPRRRRPARATSLLQPVLVGQRWPGRPRGRCPGLARLSRPCVLSSALHRFGPGLAVLDHRGDAVDPLLHQVAGLRLQLPLLLLGQEAIGDHRPGGHQQQQHDRRAQQPAARRRRHACR